MINGPNSIGPGGGTTGLERFRELHEQAKIRQREAEAKQDFAGLIKEKQKLPGLGINPASSIGAGEGEAVRSSGSALAYGRSKNPIIGAPAKVKLGQFIDVMV